MMDFIDEKFEQWWHAGAAMAFGSHKDIARQAFRAGTYLGVYQPRPTAAAAADATVEIGAAAEPYLRREK